MTDTPCGVSIIYYCEAAKYVVVFISSSQVCEDFFFNLPSNIIEKYSYHKSSEEKPDPR